MLSTEHGDGEEDGELLEPLLGDSGHVPLPPTERFVLCCMLDLIFMLLIFFLGVFLLLPDSFLMLILMLMLPGDDAAVDDVGVDVVQPDDGCCAKPLTERDGNVSSGVPALSRQAGCFWRSVGSNDEADDAGGHTHGDLSFLLLVPPNPSLPELLHDGKDVAVGSLVVPVPGLAVGTG